MLSSYPQGNVGGPSPYAISRLLRTPPHPAEPLPASRILPSLEVRGTHLPRISAFLPVFPLPLHRSHVMNCALINIFFSFIQDERHSYEKCQYEEFKKRVAKMDELRASKDGARSN
jgi:hypothetical protein